MRLRTKFAVVFVFAMLLLVGITFGSIEFFKQQTVSEAQAEVNESAQLTAQQLDRELAELIDVVRFFSTRESANLSTANRTLQQFTQNSEFFAGWAIEANGTVVAHQNQFLNASGEQDVIGTDQSNESHIRTALAGKSTIRKPEETDGGGFVLVVAHPVRTERNGTRRVSGVVAGAVFFEASGIFTLQSDNPKGQAITVTGTTADGNISTLHGEREPFADSIQRSAVVSETGWAVTVSRNRGPLQERLQTLQLLQSGGLVLVVVIFGGLGYWEYQTNLTQTRRLLEGFEAVTAGEYDYTMSLSAAEEWRRIGEGFDEMASGIEEREQTIQEREQVLSVLTRLLRHNVQNDLAVARGHVEVLPDLPEDRREDSAGTALDAIDKLLDHAENAKQLKAALESADEGIDTIDVVTTVETACEQCTREYPDAAISIKGPEDCSAWGLRTFGTAIEALVENGIEHNDSDEPRVTVNITETDETVRVTISDNGPGIPEHEQQILRLREETDLEHGSGVGLWLAHVVTEKSGGELHFSNQSDGGQVSIDLASTVVNRENVETELGTLE